MQPQKGVLRQFFGILATSHEAQRQAVDAALMMADQSYEGIGITVAGRSEVVVCGRHGVPVRPVSGGPPCRELKG
jgi:hypothetical protein